ncbi:Fruit bromelain [Ananas comosus]|uniref:Fruit bromelain n=1 Tax=Ananas comosus TaxID=4615 RepID=A0A199VSR7_ANACO|nr:Fruit bromelain [Ananas comosus]
MAEYGRVYNDNDEKLHRFQIFKNNVNHIETFNSRSGNSYTLGVNKFADMTNSEFTAQYTGTMVWHPKLCNPYQEYKATCNANYVPSSAYITGYGSLERNNETSVTYAVSNQPVAVSIHVSEDFRFYSGGVFRRPCSGSLNHAVVIIGYDQDSSSGIKYWTVKNSWGSWWV